MKILRVISTMNPQFGGPTEGLRQITRELESGGHRTDIVCLDAPESDWLRGSDLRIHALGPAVGKFHYSGRLVPWMRTNAHAFDCTIVHGVWQYGTLGTWIALRNTSLPYFVYTHGMLDPWFRKAYPAKHIKKAVYWRLVEHRVLRDAAAVLFTSEQERVLAAKSFKPYDLNARVVNYGTAAPAGNPSEQREAFLDRYRDLRGKRILLFLGRIHRKKGCDILIDAFARIGVSNPDLRLVVAGPDETAWTPQLRQSAVASGVDSMIMWAGMLSGDLKWGAFYAAEAFVLPSHSENFGIAVVESLAAGTPVLISNKVNIWREIAEEGAGLVGEDTVEGTTMTLKQWLAMNADERLLMRERARSCFMRRFDARRAAQSLVDAISESRTHLNRQPTAYSEIPRS